MLFDTLIDSVSGVYGLNTIGIHLANPSRTRHTFPHNQLGELLHFMFCECVHLITGLIGVLIKESLFSK
jgi:hypothetical protein